ncbi:MAG: hypothetical protein K0R54_1806 [Clostridiaceae bacterium]|nr:hypothetical protein [Clostridiaceae bacterium]
MELCIAYGLCKILDDNGIDWVLTNKKAYFVIETKEDFAYKDLILSTLSVDDMWSINSSLNRSEKEVRLNNLNEFLDKQENMEMIFNYYETLDDKFLKGSKSEGATYCGTCFYTKGIRGGLSPKAKNVNDFENQLSFLGFIVATTYCKTDYEVNIILFPKKIDRIQRPYNWTYSNKETGEIKHFTFFGKNSKSIVNAKIYLKTLIKFKSELMIGNYEKALYMQLSPTSKKPMADLNFEVPMLDISIDLCEILLMKIEYSKVSEDVKIITSEFLLNTKYNNFSKLIQIYAKKKELLEEKMIEELVRLQNHKVQEIYKNQSIRRVANGLKSLLRDKIGYDIQVLLLNCNTITDLSKVMRQISLLHWKYMKRPCINEEEIEEIINFADNNEAVRTIGDAILTYSSVYYKKKGTDIETEIEEIETNDMEESEDIE